MTRARSIGSTVTALCLALATAAAPGCDLELYALTNSLPVEGDPAALPEVHIYLAVDGLSLETVREMQAEGRLSAPEWSLARSMAMFPTISTASWSHILRARKNPGYELAYYDPDGDTIRNDGIGGYIEHALPRVEDAPWEGAPYYRSFDYIGDGYLDEATAYGAPAVSLGETLDNLFFLLEGRVATSPVFLGYMPEIDIFGHLREHGDVRGAVRALFDRIAALQEAHPERRITFTLFSDHGVDFIPAEPEDFVDVKVELERLGVAPVGSRAEGERRGGPWAVPILYTHMSFVALHTDPARAEEVARLVSASPTTQLVVARADRPARFPGIGELRHATVFRRGEAVLHFAHDRRTDTYQVSRQGRLDLLGLEGLLARTTDDPIVITDEEAFALLADGPYPDLLYRVRSALEPIGIEHPAEVVVAFERPHSSLGSGLTPHSANHGFHGNFDLAPSSGVILTDERPLPPVVRSYSVLDLFPALREHLDAQGLIGAPDEHGGALDYDLVEALRD